MSAPAPSKAAAALDLTWPTVLSALQRLEGLGIAQEITGRQRNRAYQYGTQLAILEGDAEG